MRNANNSRPRNSGRNDRPSGRQASEQPEHAGKNSREASTLHQGQGPEFQTQDDTMSALNEGVQQLKDTDSNRKPGDRSPANAVNELQKSAESKGK